MTLDRVITAVSQVLEVPASEISASSRFLDDLGASSLDIVNLVWRIEEEFGLEQTDEDTLEAIETVGDLAELVRAQQAPSTTALLIASDHAGVGLKADLVSWLQQRGDEVVDLGPGDGQAVDYPDYARKVAERVAADGQRGILICGSGIGMSIAANRVPGVRAALVSEPLSAALCRQHNDANVLCLGARLVGPDMARECIDAFLRTPFEPGNDGRHQRRVRAIERDDGSTE